MAGNTALLSRAACRRAGDARGLSPIGELAPRQRDIDGIAVNESGRGRVGPLSQPIGHHAMPMKTPTLAAAMALALMSGAQAQTAVGGTGAGTRLEDGVRPGSVMRGGETAIERPPADGITGATGAGVNPAMVPPGAGPAGTGMAPGTGGTAGGPAGVNR